MQGLHLTADLRGCSAALPVMVDPQALRGLCLRAVEASGLRAVGDLFHGFMPVAAGHGGITGVVLLAESHVAVHTWPELAAVTLDVYVCNLGADNSGRARVLLDALIAAFDAVDVERHTLERGARAPTPRAWLHGT